MKGRVLGFTGSTGTGTITGEDGHRYGFAIAEWRSDRAPAAGLAVDFEVRGEQAAGIYPLAGETLDIGALAASPAVARARELATGTLVFPLAILLLFACLMPAVNTIMGRGQSLSLMGLGPVVTELSDEIRAERESVQRDARDFDERESELNKVIAQTGPGTPIGPFGSGGSAGDALKELQDERAKSAATQHGHAGAFLLDLMALVYLVPVLALALIGLSWAGRPVRLAGLAAGGASLVSFVLVWNLTALAAVGDSSTLSLGFGAWLVLLAGLGLILAALGMIRNPLARA